MPSFYHIFIFALLNIFTASCDSFLPTPDYFPEVYPDLETESVESIFGEDAADDPAIWLHPKDSSKSIIFGTNKRKGIETYTLKGEKVRSYPVGKVNNIDVRYQFPLTDTLSVDILAGSERSQQQILLYAIDPDSGTLTPLGTGIPSNLSDVYGFCLFKHTATETFYAFINSKTGLIEQWKLVSAIDEIKGELVRTFSVPSQPEGMVADDQEAKLYVGEENHGIWVFDALPKEDSQPHFIPMSGRENQNIRFDIEGLAIYRSDNLQWLLASSQGNNSYAVFAIEEAYPYVGSFIVSDSLYDGTEDTDGIEVSSANLGGIFSHGIFIAQDGMNYTTEGRAEAQNFKMVAWNKIEPVIKRFHTADHHR